MKTRYNTLIIGTGCAGYSAAVRLFDLGIKDIAILTEGINMGTSRNAGSDKQTYYKLSLCGDAGDSVREMATTLYNGGGVMGEHALCEAAYSARCFTFLCDLGVPFPTNEYGEYVGYKTDHDPRERATSAGPLTSKFMTEALQAAAEARGIAVLDHKLITAVLAEKNEVRGVGFYDTQEKKFSSLACQSLILATGGPAALYAHSVYPESQHGGTGLAIGAGAALSNMNEWQYGLASTDFRWNVSGSYQQVLPRYVSVDEKREEREFLYDALGEKALSLVFLKGYQWPFDARRIDGSSAVDLLVKKEIELGRRVYLDYTKNPRGLENGFAALSEEAHTYLARAEVLFGTPIERLQRLNPAAIELYRSHGIDLAKEKLKIAVCAQHCNGGVCVDENWESTVQGLYAVGEAAGTFGVYRPGGSALNSTQVGSLRAAEHIAKKEQKGIADCSYTPPAVRFGNSNIESLAGGLRKKMSRHAAFERSTEGMLELYREICALKENFFAVATVAHEDEIPALFRLYDTVQTAKATLDAMLCSAKEDGTHGGAIVDGQALRHIDVPKATRIRTQGDASRAEAVSPMPKPSLLFEALLAKKLRERKEIQ